MTAGQVESLLAWGMTAPSDAAVDLSPSRVFLHDTNGVPVLGDLAALRDAAASLGGRVDLVNPRIPCELVVDHSVIADVFGRSDAHRRNVEIEYKLGDSVTTDHVSPAGAIPPRTPAGRYLTRLGVPRSELNSYASRRGNHEVMMRGCFANVRLRNHLVPGEVGGWTRNFRTGSVDTVFDAARTDRDAGVPLLVLGGREYGSGSSRDWAAKGPALLGVRVVLAESFERIHRSNLIGMGVLPLQFQAGEGAAALRLTGEETYEVRGLRDAVERRGTVTVLADGRTFRAIVRIDTEREADYYRHGGILPYVLRRLLAGS